MRRLRINWIFPRPGMSGGVKSNRLIAEAMARRGHNVTLIYVDGGEPWPAPWRLRTWRWRLRQAIAERGKQRHHLQGTQLATIPVRRPVIHASDVPDADVTIATWWETAEWIREWPVSKGIKAHFVRHDERLLQPAQRARVDAVYRDPMLRFVIAKWLHRLMTEEYGNQRTCLIPNGVDWNQFGLPPRPKPPRPTVGFVYSSVPWKGADMALQACLKAQGKVEDLRVVSFGLNAPPAETRIRDFVYERAPSQERIPLLYSTATCWLVPSISEGFGMPGLEAAACWNPLVTSRCGGTEDYVEQGCNGYLVDYGDSHGMANAIQRILELSQESWSKMSESSHDIARGFDWDRSAQLLEEAIHQELGARGR